jgi:predicted nucleic acid-binding protein
MIQIVVDATPMISALIGGASKEIFFDPTYEFLKTQFTIDEVKKYIPYISEKSKTPEEQIIEALHLLPLTIHKKEFYSKKLDLAKQIIEHKDKKDIDILALAIQTATPIWSEDKHFEEINEISLLKTKDFF